jgi:hypothetical protein
MKELLVTVLLSPLALCHYQVHEHLQAEEDDKARWWHRMANLLGEALLQIEAAIQEDWDEDVRVGMAHFWHGKYVLELGATPGWAERECLLLKVPGDLDADEFTRKVAAFSRGKVKVQALILGESAIFQKFVHD